LDRAGRARASTRWVLSAVESYGFSFVGFSAKVTGKFAMDEFEITLAKC
jgi:hypothetical protein